MGSGNLEEKWTSETEEIVAEAQRRVGNQKEDVQAPGLVVALNKGVLWLAEHWLALFNVIAGLYFFGSLLPPVLMQAGMTNFAYVLYRFYAPFCHQYPFRSWFFFGPRLAHRLEEPISVLEMNELRAFVGNAEVGYKTALCQRDVAIYGMMFLGGLAYGLLRKRYKVRPLSLWLYGLVGVLPMLLDGGIQWLSYFAWTFFPELISRPFETYPIMRTITGALFGLGTIALAYPRMQYYFNEVKDAIDVKFERAVPTAPAPRSSPNTRTK